MRSDVSDKENFRRSLSRGELVRLLYRLGRQNATGILKVTPRADRSELFALRRGNVMVGESPGRQGESPGRQAESPGRQAESPGRQAESPGRQANNELAKKQLIARLVRLVGVDAVDVAFDGGTQAIPPGAQHTFSLAAWARTHLEAQLDGGLADALVQKLAGIRLSIRTELAPEALDEADRRMLVAMTLPRRLDQIWPLARTPRFRLLAFIHFLRSVDALVVEGVVAENSVPTRRVDPRRAAALDLLGVTDDADVEDVKRAYRRLARALHPDLQPQADADRRRALERRFAEVTAAYESLV